MKAAVNGAELHYETHGSGPVCLVPTAIGTRPYRRLTSPVLSDRFTLAYVDLRGGGESTGRPGDLTFDVLADDLDAVRRALGVERVLVLGHSILGVLAIEYARRRPSSVSHVILAGTPPRGDMSWLAPIAAAFFEADASDDRKQRLRGNLAALPAGASPGQVVLAQTPARFFDAQLDATPLFAEAVSRPELMAHLFGALMRDWDVTVDAESLRLPILITHGRYDYTVPYTVWDGVASRLPDATLSIFPRSGHQTFFEEPDRFVREVTGWMARDR